MPAEAFIQTGERTVISYLVKPLRDQIMRAFREESCRLWISSRLRCVVCPVTPTVAFPHDTNRADTAAQFERSLMVDGVPVPYMDNMRPPIPPWSRSKELTP